METLNLSEQIDIEGNSDNIYSVEDFYNPDPEIRKQAYLAAGYTEETLKAFPQSIQDEANMVLGRR